MADQEDLTSLHWTQLKKRVEDANGEWTDKDAAIAFLQGGTPAINVDDEDLSEDDAGVDLVDETVNDLPEDEALSANQEDADDLPDEDNELVEDSTPVFNPDEYFSTVHGVGQKAKYCQNGILFDAKHNIVPVDND